MKIGVVSDTHGDVQRVMRAVEILRGLDVSLLIHCGDVGAEIVPCLRGLQAHFVCGNMDDREELREAIGQEERCPPHLPAPTEASQGTVPFLLHGQMGTLEIAGRRVAFLHGHDVKLLRETIHSGQWDLVCHGHTHAYSYHREGRTWVLNPGAIARTHHPSLAVVEMPSLNVTQIPLHPPGTILPLA